jgi:hypothetical protein
MSVYLSVCLSPHIDTHIQTGRYAHTGGDWANERVKERGQKQQQLVKDTERECKRKVVHVVEVVQSEKKGGKKQELKRKRIFEKKPKIEQAEGGEERKREERKLERKLIMERKKAATIEEKEVYPLCLLFTLYLLPVYLLSVSPFCRAYVLFM